MKQPSQISVFYDGECPLCVREIGFYQRREGADNVCWIDVSQANTDEIAPGLLRCDALSRFHVRDQQGFLYSGALAFIKVWEALPGFRLFARVAIVPPLPWVLEKLYRGFLKVRPMLQILARAFGKRQVDKPND